jgi:hypothetical protein
MCSPKYENINHTNSGASTDCQNAKMKCNLPSAQNSLPNNY